MGTVDGRVVGAQIQHQAVGFAARSQREPSRTAHAHRGAVERLEHDHRHPLAARLRGEWSFGEEDWPLFRAHAELIVERVVPYRLHVLQIDFEVLWRKQAIQNEPFFHEFAV